MPLSTETHGFIIDPLFSFMDDKGKTIKNGFVRVFLAGSSTPAVTYLNWNGAMNQETIQLDNSGRVATAVIGPKDRLYKVCVYDAHHSQETPILTVDNVQVLGTVMAILDGAVTTAKIADEAVTAAKLHENSVTTEKIANKAVTQEKLSDELMIFLNKNYVTPEMYGAVGDGEADDTAAIQTAVNSGESVVFGEKIYKISVPSEGGTAISITNKTTLLLGKATIKLTPNAYQGYYIINANGVTGLRIVGGSILGDRNEHSGTLGEWGMGIRIGSCSDVIIDGVRIENCWGDGIVVADNDGVLSSDLQINNCFIKKCRRNGIALTGVDGAVINGCTFVDIDGTLPKAGVDIEPNANGIAKNIVVENCKSTGCATGFLADGTPDNNITKENIVFRSCVSDTICTFRGCTNLVVDSLKCTTLAIGRYTLNAKIQNSDLVRIQFFRKSSASLFGCNIKNVSDDAIFFYTSIETGTVEFARFYHCNITSESGTSILALNFNSGLLDEVSFDGCVIKAITSNTTNFIKSEFHGKLKIVNTEITGVVGSYGNLISLTADSTIDVMNSKIKPSNNIAFIVVNGSLRADVTICNSEITLLYKFCNINANRTLTGFFKLFSNILMKTSLSDYDYVLSSGAVDSSTKFGSGSVFTNL